MKKARIMLSAIAVFAIVGGALAFKAHNAYHGNLFCTAVKDTKPTSITTYTITNVPGITLYCTTATTLEATTSTLVTPDN